MNNRGRTSFGSRYAIVASTLALVIALSGTAYAVATVDSGDIVDNTIRTTDVKNGTLTRTDLAPGTSAPRLYVRADMNGNIQASAGGPTVNPSALGLYYVSFGNRDLDTCAPVVSENSLVPAGSVYVGVVSGVPDRVEIRTYNSTGEIAETGFTLIVMC